MVQQNIDISGSLKISSNEIHFNNLPTSDPGVAGRLWNNNNVLNISVGPLSFTINVTGSYTFSGSDRNGSVSGGNNTTITIKSGYTLSFAVNVAGSHPFYIRNSSDNNNVSLDSGSRGSTSGTLVWTPSSSGAFYCVCGEHSSMRADITVS